VPCEFPQPSEGAKPARVPGDVLEGQAKFSRALWTKAPALVPGLRAVMHGLREATRQQVHPWPALDVDQPVAALKRFPQAYRIGIRFVFAATAAVCSTLWLVDHRSKQWMVQTCDLNEFKKHVVDWLNQRCRAHAGWAGCAARGGHAASEAVRKPLRKPRPQHKRMMVDTSVAGSLWHRRRKIRCGLRPPPFSVPSPQHALGATPALRKTQWTCFGNVKASLCFPPPTWPARKLWLRGHRHNVACWHSWCHGGLRPLEPPRITATTFMLVAHTLVAIAMHVARQTGVEGQSDPSLFPQRARRARHHRVKGRWPR